MKQLQIYFKGVYAGLLEEARDDFGYSFKYDTNYLKDPGSRPISLTLPLRAETYYSKKLFPFFSNMLPEGANRKVLCRGFHIDERDEFSILRLFKNRDIIGAITIK